MSFCVTKKSFGLIACVGLKFMFVSTVGVSILLSFECIAAGMALKQQSIVVRAKSVVRKTICCICIPSMWTSAWVVWGIVGQCLWSKG